MRAEDSGRVVERWGGPLLWWSLDVLGRLPLALSARLGIWMGRTWFALGRFKRRLAFRNVRLSFPENRDPGFVARIARESFEHAGLTFLEVLHLAVRKPEEVRRWIQVEGVEHFEKAAGRGKGVLLLTGHIGNWELLGMAASQLVGSCLVVARPLDFKPLDAYVNRLRTRTGTEVLPKDGCLWKLMRGLNRGANVGLLLDQNTSHTEGSFVPFFGRRACTYRSAAFLALTTDASVVPAYGIRRSPGRHAVRFLPALELIRTGDRTRDIEDNTALFTRTLEYIIRDIPGQWLWMHDRWKQKAWCPWPRRDV